MALNIIIGAQWGDEGKGRVTDLLAGKADIVARFSGGDNAGHTITVGDEIFKLHLIPSGIAYPDKVCLIGNGVVLNPAVFLREIDALEKRGVNISPERLKISKNAHLITPAHVALDKADEAMRGNEAIGTTQRGIGPCYTDKVSRLGLRAGLMNNPKQLAEAVARHIDAKNYILENLYGAELLDSEQIAQDFVAYAKRIAPYLVDGIQLIDEALSKGQTILAEGAQGTLLDIDHGTYPFVTSSSPTSGGALTGLGVGPKAVDQILGVAKVFTSRVGSGPFPTEIDGESALRLRGTGANPWDEYGTTTGRPRRVGWLDLMILNHGVRVNSLTEIALTKLDILSGLKEIPICVTYELHGKEIRYFPTELNDLVHCKPIYEILPGWEEDITAVRRLEDLPVNARGYIKYIQQRLGLPIHTVSVGPKRNQVIHVNSL